MTTAEIRVQLLMQDQSVASISRSSGVPRTAISQVLWGKRRTPRARRAISEAIGQPYERVWGEPDPGIDRLPVGRPRKCVTPVTGCKSPAIPNLQDEDPTAPSSPATAAA